MLSADKFCPPIIFSEGRKFLSPSNKFEVTLPEIDEVLFDSFHIDGDLFTYAECDEKIEFPATLKI